MMRRFLDWIIPDDALRIRAFLTLGDLRRLTRVSTYEWDHARARWWDRIWKVGHGAS